MYKAGSSRAKPVLIDYEVASLGDRVVAFLVDVLFLVLYLALLITFHFKVQSLPLWLMVVLLLPVVFYFLIFEIFMRGQSPGKRLRYIKVVRMDGTEPGLGSYFLRWLLWPLDNMPYGSVAIITILINGKGQRLGDLAAGTTVVKYEPAVEELLQQYEQEEDYKVQYPQVSSLSEKEVALIRESLRNYRLTAKTEGVQQMAEQMQERLSITNDSPPVRFLTTLVEDYEHLHLHG